MLEESLESFEPIETGKAAAIDRYLRVAMRQRLTAEKATLPQIREQLIRSAEKWEYLANSYDSALEIA